MLSSLKVSYIPICLLLSLVVFGWQMHNQFDNVLAQERGIDTPIIEQIVKICYEGSDPKASISALMTRKSKHEREVFWMD